GRPRRARRGHGRARPGRRAPRGEPVARTVRPAFRGSRRESCVRTRSAARDRGAESPRRGGRSRPRQRRGRAARRGKRARQPDTLARVSTVAFDVQAVRARFSALRTPLAFFDGPGGTQVPDEVIEAIASYLREENANVGGEHAASRATDALVARARLTGAGWLGCSPEEVVFGANMTTLNFALSRAAAREWRAGDEVVVTRLDH